MKNKILVYGRLLVAISFFILCGLAFLGKIYPLKIFDMQFVSALQSGIIYATIVSLVPLVVVIVLTLIFGRIYCSTFCPLGIYQEILMFLFKPFYKKSRQHSSRHFPFAYWGAVVLFGILGGGTVIWLRMVDPYAIFGNALSGAGLGIGFLVAIAVLVLFKKRFFCVNICPIGAVIGFIARFSFFKVHINDDKCKICGLCAKVCPCGAIDAKTNQVNHETCIKCFKCLAHCRHGAIYYGRKKSVPVPFNLKRRQFLFSGLMVATLGLAFKGGIDLSKRVAQKLKRVIIPAGGGKIQDFANRCLNCNLCVQNCPMKVIKSATDEVAFVHLDYQKSYCDFNCHRCSEICPSGALKHLTIAQKQKTKLATAVIDEDICVKCGLCSVKCPRTAIVKDVGQVPLVRFEECIGCGACAQVCPVKAISFEPVSEQIYLS